MQVSNAEAISKEIHGYKLDVERRLKNMVSEFAYAATRAIQDAIPIGDAESISEGGEGKGIDAAAYYRMYQARNRTWGIPSDPIEAGLHRGNISYNETNDFAFVNRVIDEDIAALNVRSEADSFYNIGDTFYIGGSAPAFDKLEAGFSQQAPDGISSRADSAIANIYRLNMKMYYDQGSE